MPTAAYSDFVRRQRDDIPALYGAVDFSTIPERLDTEAKLEDERFDKLREYVARVFDNPDLLERVRDSTMTGDRVADAYAALIPQLGFPALTRMLDEACEQGVDHLDDPPPELVAFIRAMEATPDWVDMSLVEAGARAAFLATPFLPRTKVAATLSAPSRTPMHAPKRS
jgi:hypothetical protein